MNNSTCVPLPNSTCCQETHNTSSAMAKKNIGQIVIWMPILSALIVFANTALICTIIKTPRLHTVTNYLICVLAVSDWLIGCPALPLTILQINKIVSTERACMVINTILQGQNLVSSFLFVLVGVDRYLAIVTPLLYHSHVTKRRAIVSTVLVMLYSFLIAILPLLGWNNIELRKELGVAFDRCDTFFINRGSYLALLSLHRVLLTLILTFLYAKITCIARSQARKVRAAQTVQQGQVRRANRTKRGIFILAAMVILYNLANFTSTLSYILETDFFTVRMVQRIRYFFVAYLSIFFLMPPVSNPFLYGLANRDIRLAAKGLFGSKNMQRNNHDNINSVDYYT